MSRKTVTIFGGSGGLGRFIARRLAKQGHRIRVAVRRPNEALFVRSYGEVGQVEPVQVNIRDQASITRVVNGADIVINTVGILYEDRFQSFDDIHHIAAGRIAEAAKTAGVSQFVHISAIGADDASPSTYGRSKAAGEKAVLGAFPRAIIIRPSVMFGGADDIFSRFAPIARLLPFLPVISGSTKFQPVYVDNVAEIVEHALASNASGKFELGGSEVFTMHEIMALVNQQTARNRPMIAWPKPLAKIQAHLLSFAELITLGIFKNRMITPDQLRSLEVDNVVTGKNALRKFGVDPVTVASVIEPYMRAYRPRGEFEVLAKPLT